MKNNKNFRYLSTMQSQRGAALLVSMIMILLVLLLAVVAMRSVTLESRTTANQLINQTQFETADGTLREGERILLQHAVALSPCEAASGNSVVIGGIPCYVSEVQADTNGLAADFVYRSELSKAFTSPSGHWYPRYIATECPKGKGAAAALSKATSGCTEYHEINAQATDGIKPKTCGPDGLCLRSAVNMFIK